MTNIVDVAFEIGFNCHKGQYRKGEVKICYFTHCVDVMKRLVLWGVTCELTLAAALLHDVLEDCDITADDLMSDLMAGGVQKADADAIVKIVVDCTRSDEDSKSRNGKMAYLKSFKHKFTQALMIKLADRYSNVMDYKASGNEYYIYYAAQAYCLYEFFDDRRDSILEFITNSTAVENAFTDVGTLVEFYHQWLDANLTKSKDKSPHGDI